MEDVLKIKKGRWKSSKSCLFRLCSIGPMLFVCLNFPLCLNFYLFVPLYPLNGVYLCILPVYLDCAPLRFSMNQLFIKKNKKEANRLKVFNINNPMFLRN
jgi:hypothetical protein